MLRSRIGRNAGTACQWACKRAGAACLCCLAVGLCCLAGCGEPGRGGLPVSGSVMLDGSPMQAGSIIFVPREQGHKAAGPIVEGEFSIGKADGPRPGHYRIEIYAPEASGVPLDDPLAYAKSAPAIPPPNPVAPRFNTQSQLQATVTATGENSFSFEVASGKP